MATTNHHVEDWVEKQKYVGSFSPRANHISVCIGNGKFLVQGGVCEKLSSLDKVVYVFEHKFVDNKSGWYSTTVPVFNSNEGPPRLWSHSCVYDSKRNSVYVFGGKNTLRSFNETYQLNLETWQWFKVVNVQRMGNKFRLPCKRTNHTAVVLGNEMVVFGGQFEQSLQKNRILNDIWAFDLETHVWREIVVNQKCIPPERHSHGAVVVDNGNSILIWGGISRANQKLLDCWLFNRENNTWRQIVLTGPVPQHRIDFQMTSIGNNLIVCFGGYNNMRYCKDFFVIDLLRRRYINLDIPRKSLPSSRKAHSICHLVCDEPDRSAEFLAILGGQSRKRGRLDDLWTMDTALLKQYLILNCDSDFKDLYNNIITKYERIQSQIKLSETSQNPTLSEVINIKNLDTNEVTPIQFEIEKPSTLYQEKFKLEIELREFGKALSTLTRFDIAELDVHWMEQVAQTYYQNGDYQKALQVLNQIDRNQMSVDAFILLLQTSCTLSHYSDAADAVKDLLDHRAKKLKPLELAEITEWKGVLSPFIANFASKFIKKPSFMGKTDVDNIGYTDVLDDTFYEAETAMIDDVELEMNGSVHQEDTERSARPDASKTHDVIIAGGPKSGVTTILQQLRTMFLQSISPAECLCYSLAIQDHTLSIFFSLLEFIDAYSALIKNRSADETDPDYTLDWAEPHRKQQAEELLKKYHSDGIEVEDYPSICQLAADVLVQKSYTNRFNLFGILSVEERGTLNTTAVNILLNYNVRYFMRHLSRILSETFMPLPYDVLFLSEKLSFLVPKAADPASQTRQSIASNSGLVRSKNDNSKSPEHEDVLLLDFLYKRVPYRLVQVNDEVNEDSGTASYLQSKFNQINSVVIVASLGDLYKKIDPKILPSDEVHQEAYPGITVNRNSAASLITAMQQFYHVANAPEFVERPVLVVFTHMDIYPKLRDVNIDLFQVFPHYIPDFKDKSSRFLEKVFLDLNNLGPKNRKVHFRYIDATDRVQVANTFKFVDTLTNAVRAHSILKELKML